MITAICNVFIDSEFKLGLFKETFSRVYPVSDNWLVYVRGKYRKEVVQYIQAEFPDYRKTCVFYSYLHGDNWAKSTSRMLKDSRYSYVYTFLEDHFLLKPVDYFREVIQEMMNLNIEYFMYSFFNVGLSVQSSEGLLPDYSKYFYRFQFNKDNVSYLKKNNSHFYPYSLVSVCTKQYFKKLLAIEDTKLIKVPKILQALMENFWFIYPKNRAFWFNVNKAASKIGIRFVIYPPETPFNLEKSLFDCDEGLRPLLIGGLREELFANWDDDNILSNSSLVKRGLYPMMLKSTTNIADYQGTSEKESVVSKGHVETRQFYPEKSRISNVPVKQVSIKTGSVRIYSERESYVLNEGDSMNIHANIPHKIEVLENATYSVRFFMR